MSLSSLRKTSPYYKPIDNNYVQMSTYGLESLVDDGMADVEIDSGDGNSQQ
jgi:hypothetical protein